MPQKTSATLNSAFSMFNSVASANHEMDVDVGHATSEPQSTGDPKDLIPDPVVFKSSMFSFFLLIMYF